MKAKMERARPYVTMLAGSAVIVTSQNPGFELWAFRGIILACGVLTIALSVADMLLRGILDVMDRPVRLDITITEEPLGDMDSARERIKRDIEAARKLH